MKKAIETILEASKAIKKQQKRIEEASNKQQVYYARKQQLKSFEKQLEAIRSIEGNKGLNDIEASKAIMKIEENKEGR